MRPPMLRGVPITAEFVYVRIRAAGVGVPYALATLVLGGTAEYAPQGFKSFGHEGGFSRDATAAIARSGSPG